MEDPEHIIYRLLKEAHKKREAALERAERAKRDAERHAVEVEAYDKALKAMRADVVSNLEIDFDLEAPQRSGASDKWVSIYSKLYETASAPYGYDDIDEAVSATDHTASKGAQRTQMMNAVKSGWFARVAQGKFEFTKSGLDLIGVSRKENEPPKGGSETGEVGASPDPEALSRSPGMPVPPSSSGPAPHSGGEGGD